MKVEIYSIPNCTYCSKAKFLAEHSDKVHEVEYKMMGAHYSAADVRELFPTARTFPQIVVTEVDNEGHPVFETEVAKSIGGYTEYEHLCNEKG